nr:hypothetical protein [Tanacetum cinerariifolium]
MANENVPAQAPTRSDDQILPFAAWVPIRKSNFVLDLQKKQKNPIFQISVDILQNNNFFRAFTTSASVPAIYIQQFWNTLTEALEITPIDQAHQFMSPSSGDAIIGFMNQLGYTEIIICHLGRIHNIHQRSASLFHLAEEDFKLGNLKFFPKGEIDEVFGKPIPNELISNNIRNAPYYNAYLEMVTKHDWKVVAKKEGKKKTFQVVDEPNEEPTHSEPEPKLVHQGEGDEDDMELDSRMSLDSFQAQSQEVMDEDQAGPDPGESCGALVGPDPKPTHDEFMADLYPKNFGSRVYTLELKDLPHKIDKAIREKVKETVQTALQAPLQDHFRDLSEEDMKEMLHQRMFESGSYKSMEECHKMLTDQVDWANPEGDQVRIDVSKPLPLSGPPGHVTIQTQFFFNHDLDYLRYGSKGTG